MAERQKRRQSRQPSGADMRSPQAGARCVLLHLRGGLAGEAGSGGVPSSLVGAAREVACCTSDTLISSACPSWVPENRDQGLGIAGLELQVSMYRA